MKRSFFLFLIALQGFAQNGAQSIVKSLNNIQFPDQYATGGDGSKTNPWTSPSGTGGVQEAINAICGNAPNTAGEVHLRAGYYSFKGTRAEVLIVPCPLRLEGASPMSTVIWLAPNMPNTVNIIRVRPSTNDPFLQDNWIFRNFSIRKSSGGLSGGDAFLMDGTVSGSTGPANVEISRVYVEQSALHGHFIRTVGTSSSNMWNWHIYDNSASGGILLTEATADTILIEHNALSYSNAGVEVTSRSGAAHVIISENNITAPAGCVHVHAATEIKILHNQCEQIAESTETNRAMIDLDGDITQIVEAEVVGNNLNSQNKASINVRVNNTTRAHIHDNVITLAASKGVGVQVTKIAVGTIIGPNYFVGVGSSVVGVADSAPAGANATQFYASSDTGHESYRMLGTNTGANVLAIRGASGQGACMISAQNSSGKELGCVADAFGIPNVPEVRTKSGIISNTGTALLCGGITLSAAWGSTASVSNCAGGNATFTFTLTARGVGIGANPTIAVTFPDGSGAWTGAANVVCQLGRGDISPPANVIPAQTKESLTTPVFTFPGTPIAETAYTFRGTCQGR